MALHSDLKDLEHDGPDVTLPKLDSVQLFADKSPFIVLDETEGLCDNLSIFPLFDRIRKAVTATISSFEHFFV